MIYSYQRQSTNEDKMIEVRAKLTGGPVYFTGDKISCRITFCNTHQTSKSHLNYVQTKDSADGSEVLGWASAQVVCICSINPQKVLDSISKSNSMVMNNSTSLSPRAGERGLVIFSTKPKILVCDLRLPDDTYADYLYEEKIPSNLPPSFRGQAIKYSYKLKIGLQRVGASVKLLHVPLRLMTWQNLIGLPSSQDEQEVVVSNPFLRKNISVNSEFDDPLETMQLLTSRRSPSVFKVTNSRGKVVSLCLFKTGYRLGEDIVGTLDFGDSQVSCTQYSVTLQSQEVVPENKRFRIGGHQSNKPGDESVVTSYSKHHEFCVGFLQTHLSLPVPLHVTQSFDTDMIALKWRLHFEFVTAVTALNWSGETAWEPPPVMNIETMVWDLPIIIHPTAPSHVSKALYGVCEGIALL